MCINRHERRFGTMETSYTSTPPDSTLNHTYTAVTSSLSWTRTFRQPMKPMLPRKLTSSARINLNQYWNILEELVSCDVTMDVQDGGDDMSNEINENLANERLEWSRDRSAMCQGSRSKTEIEVNSHRATCSLSENHENCTNCVNSRYQKLSHST